MLKFAKLSGKAALLLLVAFLVKAESLDELLFYLKAEKEASVQKSGLKSEPQLLAGLLIKIYQRYISSTDLPSCNFTLSCSRFAQRAIERFGLVHGLLMTSDRLQRCVRWSRAYYRIDPETGLAIDLPLKFYYLGKKK